VQNGGAQKSADRAGGRYDDEVPGGEEGDGADERGGIGDMRHAAPDGVSGVESGKEVGDLVGGVIGGVFVHIEIGGRAVELEEAK
jgi:hypothetical protein